jgi:hypothetical protein
VLRRKIGPKREELPGEWRKLSNEELDDLDSSPIFSGHEIEKNELGGACSTYWGHEMYIQDF